MRMKRSRYSEPYKPTESVKCYDQVAYGLNTNCILLQETEIKPYYKFDSFDVSLESSDDTDTNTKSVSDIVDLREANDTNEPSDTIEDNLIETEVVSAGDNEKIEDTTDPAVF